MCPFGMTSCPHNRANITVQHGTRHASAMAAAFWFAIVTLLIWLQMAKFRRIRL
jgi:hypothetical protein